MRTTSADMFTKRTIRQAHAVTSVDTASEALAVSIAEHACVNMDYMSQLSGKSAADLAAELRGVIFQVPDFSENSIPHYVTADEYLSGNIRKKLAQARQAAQKDVVFQDNVAALEKAQPKDLDASEIDVRLGATWIDKQYIQKFMEELLVYLYLLLLYLIVRDFPPQVFPAQKLPEQAFPDLVFPVQENPGCGEASRKSRTRCHPGGLCCFVFGDVQDSQRLPALSARKEYNPHLPWRLWQSP